MHPQVVKILDELGEREFRFGFYTNGKLLTDDTMAALIRNASGDKEGKLPSYISFNVTAMLDEQNTEGLTDKDSPRQEQLRKIKQFTDLNRSQKSPITVNASLLALRVSVDYPQIVRELNEANVDNIRLSFPWLPQNDPREKRVLGGLEADEFEDRTKTFIRLSSEYGEKVSVRLPSQGLRHCFVMTQSLAISPEGDVFPCPEVCSPHFRASHCYGNILRQEQPISRIWGSPDHISRFFGMHPEEKGCVCCHVDREVNEELARYWDYCSFCESGTDEAKPVGVIEGQWAGPERPVSPAPSQGGPTPAGERNHERALETSPNVFRKEGEEWRVVYNGEPPVFVRHMTGLDYIQRVIEAYVNNGFAPKEIRNVHLIPRDSSSRGSHPELDDLVETGGFHEPTVGGNNPPADASAISEYRKRSKEIDQRLAQLEADGGGKKKERS